MEEKTYIITCDGFLYEYEYPAENEEKAKEKFCEDFEEILTGEEEIIIREK